MKCFFMLFIPMMVYSQGYQVKVVPIGSKEVNGNINVATLTLVFEPNSIGKDFEAAHLIAKNEALKIGADSITFISSTVYSSKVDQTFQGSDRNIGRLSANSWGNSLTVNNIGASNTESNSTLIATGTENDIATYTCRAIKIYSPVDSSIKSEDHTIGYKILGIIGGGIVIGLLMIFLVNSSTSTE